jgi:predicted phosphodiesterase
MRKVTFRSYVDRLFKKAPRIPFNSQDRIVIFSDLHIGDNTRNDDFFHNGDEFVKILQHYYKNGYKVVLNGDIEELMRFSHELIRRSWPKLYGMLDRFEEENRLYRIYGNHDYFYASRAFRKLRNRAREAYVLKDGEREIFVLHGHQSRTNYSNKYTLISFILRYLARPLKIGNFSVAHDKRKKYSIEQFMYNFARKNKIAVALGHTHRPLFESLSKKDNLKFNIEKLCRRYGKVQPAKREKIAEKIQEYNTELKLLAEQERRAHHPGSLYDMDNIVPCLFNSGCGIGKSGITALEIYNGRIALVHWLNRNEQSRLVSVKKKKMKTPAGCTYARVTLKEDELEYIFTRIHLLS